MTVTIHFQEQVFSLEAEPGCLLSSVIQKSGLPFSFPCAGRGTCKNCRVVAIGALSDPDGEECAAFTDKQRAAGWRLACRASALGNAQVWLTAPSDSVAVLSGETALPAEGSPFYTRYGLSVDIGTTTLCAQLCAPKGEIARAVCTNPQASFGADVVSRMEAALSGEADTLRTRVWEAITLLAENTVKQAGLSLDLLDGAVMTGNTVMLSLLTGWDVRPMTAAPFQATHLFGEVRSCRNCYPYSMPIWDKVYFPPCISAFLGADVTTAILASKLCERQEAALLVDIGTNGEMALWTGTQLLCCSTAAGPAFEGGGLSHGVCGIHGAIDHVWVKNRTLQYSTIGNSRALGICGSGAIDALASMLRLGIIDETGAFSAPQEAVEIAPGIRMNGADVRTIQLAKASVRAGIETLLETAGIKASDISRFYLAGGFGSYLNLESAADIGLLPEDWLDRVNVIGNAAHTGATILLQNQTLQSKIDCIVKRAETIPLHDNTLFSNYFTEFMLFPETT